MKEIPSGHAEILERIRSRRDYAVEYWEDMRKRQAADAAFRDIDNQWPAQEKAKRLATGRPCMVVDHTNAFINQLVNDERQNRPSVMVSPIHDGADQDLAELLQGFFRHVEMISNADYAYDRASEAQKGGGFGFLRAGTAYVNENSFNQEPRVLSVLNPFQWMLDPMSTEPDGSDAKWAIGEVEMDRDEFEKQYPNSSLASEGVISSAISTIKGWIGLGKRTVLVAEYYELEQKKVTICALPDGRIVDKSTLSTEFLDAVGDIPERESTKTTCQWYKTNGLEILDSRRFPGKLIPIVPVYGSELVIDGKVDYFGMVRAMKDPAILVNAYESNIAEAIGLNNRTPWLVAMGSIPAGAEKDWKTANRQAHDYLTYKHKDQEGTPYPPPHRENTEPAIQAMTIAKDGAFQNIKAVTGLFDPSRGQSDNNQSGKAIGLLQRQGQTSNFHYTDNFNRSLRQLWRVILGITAEIVDTESMIRVVGQDGVESRVKVNSAGPVDNIKGDKKVIYNMAAADGCDIHISAGPSFASKRQENLNFMLEMAKIDPKFLTLADDLMFANSDVPAAKEIAERLVPPQFKKPEDGKQQLPPGIQQYLQQSEQQKEQMGQMIESLSQKVHALSDQIERKDAELELKWRIACLNDRTTAVIELAKLGSAEAKAEMQALIQTTENESDRQHDINLSLLDHAKSMDQSAQTIPPANAAGGQTQDQDAGSMAGEE